MNRETTLRKQEDFDRLRKKGTALHSKYVVFVFLGNGSDTNRKAFLASKKIGNSVQRHRAARLMRESFRLIEKENDIPKGMDYLLIAKSPINESKCADVKKSIEAAMIKAKLI